MIKLGTNILSQTVQRNLGRATEPASISIVDSSGKAGIVYIQLRSTRGSLTTPMMGIPEVPAVRDIVAYARNENNETAIYNASYDPSSIEISFNLTFSVSAATASVTLDISGLSYQSRDKTGILPLDVLEDAETRQTAIGFTGIYNSYASRRALDTVKNRIDDLSALEGQYGAIESRLNVAHNLLASAGENFASAASRIKDADIATEAANSVRSGILQQAATSLLAQANQAPQVALSLLRGI